ncbi:MAG: hypothetical protein HOP12_02645 [Candidatus Eisenbacteria bacterium]|uniref:Uncharacterized protein n=1 Tax=Eiseniibacteriota bacterium TaxID=2212470 RepID=A0A849SBJ6_UNCEI|nr:hypothetical protein [Candidatus Eisenbacteria bacterium]
MKRLIIFALFVAAAWYGWKNYGTVFERKDSHEAMIENLTGEGLQRVRLIVDGQTLVRESIKSTEVVKLPFRVNRDSDFELIWQWEGRMGEMIWRGGRVTAGPMTQRHRFVMRGDRDVVYLNEPKSAPAVSR